MVQIKFSEDFNEQPALIKAIGLGGAGGNAVNRMIESGLAWNSSRQHRQPGPAAEPSAHSAATGRTDHQKDSGGRQPILGRQATEGKPRPHSGGLDRGGYGVRHRGHGRGHGHGSAPVVAQIARELDPKPSSWRLSRGLFDFEGQVQKNQGDQGIEELRPTSTTMLAIPNDRLFDIIESTTSPRGLPHGRQRPAGRRCKPSRTSSPDTDSSASISLTCAASCPARARPSWAWASRTGTAAR